MIHKFDLGWATLIIGLLCRPGRATTDKLDLPDGVFAFPLFHIKDQTAYGFDMNVGTPPQTVQVLADTGSPTYSVESPYSPSCKEGLCDLYGVYDNTSSSTTEWISSSFNDILIDHGYGSMINDTVTTNGHKFPNMTLGQLEGYAASYPITTPQAAIFGLGALCDTKDCDTYPTFVQQLYDRGAIAKRAFSFYLGSNDADATGMLLIGGVDEAKRQGPVYKRKVQDPTELDANSSPTLVPLESISLRLHDGNSTTKNYPKDTYTRFDTGSPYFYMPNKVFNHTMVQLGLSPDAETNDNDRYDVSCKYLEPNGDVITASFGDGAEIEVPLNLFVTQLEDNKCVTNIAPNGPSFGDPFLRGLHVTFDYDELTVDISAVKYTDESRIKAIT